LIVELLFAVGWVFVVVLWIIVIYIYRASGWPKLAKHYGTNVAFNGYTWQVRSDAVRGLARYRGGLTVGVNPAGIYLAVLTSGEHGYLPLFIPWEEVSVASEGALMVFTFRKAPDAKLRVDDPFGREVLERAARDGRG
jgi:hypothetical protein